MHADMDAKAAASLAVHVAPTTRGSPSSRPLDQYVYAASAVGILLVLWRRWSRGRQQHRHTRVSTLVDAGPDRQEDSGLESGLVDERVPLPESCMPEPSTAEPCSLHLHRLQQRLEGLKARTQGRAPSPHQPWPWP
mgnify:CR=1 FL=1